MAHLFSRERNSMTESRRRNSITISPSSSLSYNLESPFGELSNNLTTSELRETAYEIFVGACRSSGGKPLTYIPSSSSSASERSPSFNYSSSLSLSSNFTHSSSSLQRSLTATAASKVKKALGMKSKKESGGGSGNKKVVTIGELMRIQMKISESSDSRTRRGLLRSFAGQLGKRIESMVLPLELLQQLKSSEFIDQHEYEAWQIRNMKVLEAGLLLHPHLPLDKSDASSQQLRQIIKGAMDKPIETGKNSESMQVLRSAVMSLACRSFNGVTDTCHWADGFPLNIRLYQMLLEACFDTNEETSVIEEIDEILELIKKTWAMLGINQLLHNLCFAWVLFVRYVSTGQTDNELLFAADNQLAEVAKDAKVTKDPIYSKILSSTLSSIQGWAEKRLLAYHDTFHDDNIESMECVVSLGVSAAKILVEDISLEYRRKRKEVVDVPRDRVDTYIRSSLRTAFAQRMEKADLSRRASRNKGNLLSRLSILANDISELATNEKEVFSPILKRWHPHAAGVGVATLHSCYGNELKQFISGIAELTPDAIQTLRAADKLEKDLVQIAVEESVDSDDGGKSIIREMPPYEAENAISNLVKVWIKSRIDILKEWVDRNLQQETWSSHANSEKFAPSAVEVLRIIDETLDAFFLLPILTHQALLPDLVAGLDRSLLHYITKTKSGCGTRNAFLPTMPALTRCTMGSKFSVWKKKEKLQVTQRKKSQVGDNTIEISELCVRLNTLQHIRTEFENMERRIVTYLRNTESAFTENIVNGSTKRFDLSPPACLEGIQQLSESLAYKIVFHDLSYVLYEGLYVGDPSFTRIEPFLKELEQKLEMIVETVHTRVRTRVITEIMKASFDGFILVLLAGGPTRSFTIQDYQIIDEDFKGLKDLFWSNGDGLPDDLIDKHSKTVREILPIFKTDTEGLIQRFRNMALEAYGGSAKTRLPLPATSGIWSPTEPNTLLRALCYRHDEAASKFLKKTYNLPKKL